MVRLFTLQLCLLVCTVRAICATDSDIQSRRSRDLIRYSKLPHVAAYVIYRYIMCVRMSLYKLYIYSKQEKSLRHSEKDKNFIFKEFNVVFNFHCCDLEGFCVEIL